MYMTASRYESCHFRYLKIMRSISRQDLFHSSPFTTLVLIALILLVIRSSMLNYKNTKQT